MKLGSLTAGGLIVLLSSLAVVSTSGLEYLRAEEGCPTEIFDQQFHDGLKAYSPDLVVTAAVFDTRSGCWFDLYPDESLTTASAIKLHILSANLLQSQERNADLSATAVGHAERMLRFSHNYPSTSYLYGQVGVTGMRQYSDVVGAANTSHTSVYGITRASARDLTLTAVSTIDLDYVGPLTNKSRLVAREILSGTHESQRWGISAGLPEGWTSLLKNGFFPCSSSRCAPFASQYTWRVASTGFNEAPGRAGGYGISILTDGATSQAEGIAAVELVARHVALALTEGPEIERLVDSSNCTEVRSGESSSAIAQRLGLQSSDWPEILWTSGNEGPLAGQLMCGDQPRAKTQPCICPARPAIDHALD